jgi:mannose-1-phosphate guanylyltransferase / phosphomannomutase
MARDVPEVVILAGGSGTRLRPFTLERPKTLIPVCNVSVLERILRELAAAGFSKATATLPALDKDGQKLLRDAIPDGFELISFVATKPFMGTAASVADVLGDGKSSVLVIYGDSLLSVDFRALLDAHDRTRARGGLATVLYHTPDDLRIAEFNDCTYHGVMQVDDDGEIQSFIEKPPIAQIPADGVANAAVFIVERSLLTQFSDALDFSYDIFQPAVQKKLAPLYGCGIGSGFRLDVGSVRRLMAANFRLLRGELKGFMPSVEALAEGATFIPPVLVGRKTTIAAGARVGPDVVIGGGCEIGEGTVIERSVLMANCRVGAGAVLRDAVLGAFSIVEAGATLPPFSVLGPYGNSGGDSWPEPQNQTGSAEGLPSF